MCLQSPDAPTFNQCQPALLASCGMVTAARRGGRLKGKLWHMPRAVGLPGRAHALPHARKRCKVQVSLHLNPSHEQSQPQAFQPCMPTHLQSSGSHHQPSLRRSARLAAKRATMPELPVMPSVTPPQIGSKRPLSRPPYPTCKRIRLMVHQQPSMRVHLSSAMASSRCGALAVYSAVNSPRLRLMTQGVTKSYYVQGLPLASSPSTPCGAFSVIHSFRAQIIPPVRAKWTDHSRALPHC